MYLYSLYQRKVQQAFDRQHHVLTQEQIFDLIQSKDKKKILDVFYSAVVDHHAINDKPYHLSYPVNPPFAHDQFKRAVIADSLGQELKPRTQEEAQSAVKILERFLSSDNNAGYVQILAWQALGIIIREYDNFLEPQAASFRLAMRGPTAGLIGALLFAEHLASVS